MNTKENEVWFAHKTLDKTKAFYYFLNALIDSVDTIIDKAGNKFYLKDLQDEIQSDEEYQKLMAGGNE